MELFDKNARFLYKKSHIIDTPYTFIKELDSREGSSSMAFHTSLEASQALEPDDIRKSVFIDKFEDIGMTDPSEPQGGSSKEGHHKGKDPKGSKPAPASPQKKKEKKPHIKNIDFNKYVYPDCKMENHKRPPSMIYIPSAEIMRRLIKGCIKVESVAELMAKF